MHKVTIVATIIALSLACESPEMGGSAEPQVIDSVGVRVVVNPSPDADAWDHWIVADTPAAVVGAVAGERPYLLKDVSSAVVLPGGGMLIADGATQELRFYDLQGSHVTSVGGEGRGPGEFMDLHLAGVFGGDSLLVVDQLTRRGVVYDTEGNQGRSLVYDDDFRFPLPVGVLDGGRMVAEPGSSTENPPPSRPPGAVERPEWEVEISDAHGGLETVLGSFPGREYFRDEDGRGQGQVLFGRGLHVAAARDRVAVANDDAYRIRVYDSSGTLLHVIAQPRTPGEIGRADVDARIADLVSEHQIPAFRERMAAALRSGPQTATFPALASLHVDRARNVWVQEFRRPRSDVTVWQVFGPEGLPKGRVSIPAHVELLDAGADYILVLRRDANHVERVERYALAPAAG